MLADDLDACESEMEHLVRVNLSGSIFEGSQTVMSHAIEKLQWVHRGRFSQNTDAPFYSERAAWRRQAMRKHLWNGAEGYFGDYDLERGCLRPNVSAAALAPLLAGLATDEEAHSTAEFTRRSLLAPGGLRTTIVDSGQQWDRPNGWASLQWIAVAGLRRYGHQALADDISQRWIATVSLTYEQTGLLYEKYDIETPGVGFGGEYTAQIGFGWTNGVTADLLDEQEALIPT